MHSNSGDDVNNALKIALQHNWLGNLRESPRLQMHTTTPVPHWVYYPMGRGAYYPPQQPVRKKVSIFSQFSERSQSLLLKTTQITKSI